MSLFVLRFRAYLLVIALANISMFAQDGQARGFDMDCKVILCIAGGFPTSCGDAYSYMIDRITDKPPKPPFGFCAMSDGSEYKAYDVDYRFLYRGPEAYDCPTGRRLFYGVEGDDGGWGNETAFCYSHTTIGTVGFGDDSVPSIIYHNQSPATRVNFQLKIIIEPGTEQEYRSPLFRVNTYTGYVSQRAP